MSKLYGLPNKVISEIAMELMRNEELVKFLYYKDTKEDEDVLEKPPVPNPMPLLFKKQIFPSRKVQKILHGSDVCIFINLDDYRFTQRNNKVIKLIQIKIGVLVQERCLHTPHGARDIALVTAIEQTLAKSSVGGIGRCIVDRVNPLFGIPPEYHGFELVCRVEGMETKEYDFKQ